MHPTTLLHLLALSATSILSLPTSTTTNTTEIEKRWYNGPSIGSFLNPTCSGKPLTAKLTQHGWDCFKFSPQSDNIGLNWGGDRALGVNFFTDEGCEKWATKTIWSPASEGLDNGKGKADMCIRAALHGGAGWRSVKFVYDDAWTRAERGKANHGH